MDGLGPVAITGATGFIGGAMADLLLQGGTPVAILARSASERTQALESKGARVVIGDLDTGEALTELCRDAHGVVHCAAEMSKGDLAKSTRVNVGGTRSLLEASAAEGVARFLYVSSISVYRGTPSATRVFTEQTAPVLHPGLNVYSRTKLEGEHAVEQFCAEHPLSYTTVRPTNVYGPGCRPWGTSVAESVKRFHLAFGNLPFDFVHIADLVEGMRRALESTDAEDQAFNLGCEMVPLREFYEFIARQHDTRVFRLPGPIDAAVRHGIDAYARLRGQVRSTGYSVVSYYPHTRSTEAFGYAPEHRVLALGAEA